MRRHLIALVIAAAVTCGIWAQSPAPGQYGALAGGLVTAQITLSAAQINAMGTTPVPFIPAQGAGTVISIQKCIFNAVWGSAAFTGGGAIGVFYSGLNGASATVAATFLTTFSGNQTAGVIGSFATTAIGVNTAVLVANNTANFAAGTGSSLIVNCQYTVTTGMQ